MNSPGGSIGGSGYEGGSVGSQGGGQTGSNNPTAIYNIMSMTTVMIDSTTPTASSASSFSWSSSSSTSSSPDSTSTSTLSGSMVNSSSKFIIIGGVVGGSIALLIIIFLSVWFCNRRSKSKEKAQQVAAAAAKKSRTLPSGTVASVSYSGLNREFSGVPFRRPDSTATNPNNIVPRPLFSRNNTESNVSSIAHRRDASRAWNPVINVGDGNRDSARGGISREDLLPTYAESQSDALSMRVLTPQFPQPSAFLEGSAVRTAGFLSPTTGSQAFESPSPYTSQIFSPDSFQTEFYQSYATPSFIRQSQYEDSGDGSSGLGVGRQTSDRASSILISPLPPLEPPSHIPAASPLRATDSLEDLVRGPGGLLARSGSVRTSVSTFSGVGDDGELRVPDRSLISPNGVGSERVGTGLSEREMI